MHPPQIIFPQQVKYACPEPLFTFGQETTKQMGQSSFLIAQLDGARAHYTRVYARNGAQLGNPDCNN